MHRRPKPAPLQIADDQSGDGHGGRKCAHVTPRPRRSNDDKARREQRQWGQIWPNQYCHGGRDSGGEHDKRSSDELAAQQNQPAHQPRRSDRYITHRLHRFDQRNGTGGEPDGGENRGERTGNAQRQDTGCPHRQRKRDWDNQHRADEAARRVEGRHQHWKSDRIGRDLVIRVACRTPAERRDGLDRIGPVGRRRERLDAFEPPVLQHRRLTEVSRGVRAARAETAVTDGNRARDRGDRDDQNRRMPDEPRLDAG